MSLQTGGSGALEQSTAAWWDHGGGTSQTIAAWIYVAGDGDVLGLGDPAGEDLWAAIFRDNTGSGPNVQAFIGTNFFASTTGSVEVGVTGVWLHVAIVYTLGTSTTTVYARTEAETSYTTVTSLSTLGWGFRASALCNPNESALATSGGRVSMLRLWLAALDTTELYAESNSTTAVRTSNLFSDTSCAVGSTIGQDTSGNANNWSTVGSGLSLNAAEPTFAPTVIITAVYLNGLSGSTSVTVPAGCKFAALSMTTSGGGIFTSEPTLNSVSGTPGGEAWGGGNEVNIDSAYWLNPAAGSQTITWAIGGGNASGPLLCLKFVVCDGEITVIDTDASNADPGPASATSTSTTGDIALACAYSLDAPPSIGGTDATPIGAGDDFDELFGQPFTVTAGSSSTTATSDGVGECVVLFILREGGSVGPGTPTLSPADNATGVSTTPVLILDNFTENVGAGTGDVVIKKSSDNSTIETIDITNGSKVSFSTTTCTITPTTRLLTNTEYYIQVASGAIISTVDSEPWEGISDTTSWTFTTELGPILQTFNPPDESSSVIINSDFILTFNIDVQEGTGNLVLKLQSDDSTVISIDVTDTGKVNFSNNIITITTSVTLQYSTGYYWLIDSGAIEDTNENPWEGISDENIWNFTTTMGPIFVNWIIA